MIGGDDDDIEALLGEVGAMAEGPRMRTRAEPSPSGGPLPTPPGQLGARPRDTMDTRGTPEAMVQPGSSQSMGSVDQMAKMVDLLIRQNQQLTDVVKGQQEERKNSEERSIGKRKNKEEISYHPEEPVMLFEESYRIEDDSHEVIDTSLRQRLGAINADPETYWKKNAFKQVERPILGSSLYLEHSTPGKSLREPH